MIAMVIPDDLKRAPFEIVRDFVIEFNKSLVSRVVDPTKIARDFLVQKYAEKEEPQGKIFLQSEMKGCI